MQDSQTQLPAPPLSVVRFGLRRVERPQEALEVPPMARRAELERLVGGEEARVVLRLETDYPKGDFEPLVARRGLLDRKVQLLRLLRPRGTIEFSRGTKVEPLAVLLLEPLLLLVPLLLRLMSGGNAGAEHHNHGFHLRDPTTRLLPGYLVT